MENKKVEMVKAQEYTKTELLEDISTPPEEHTKETSEKEKAHRDFIYKLKVLQYIIDPKLPPYDFKKDNMDDIKKQIEVYVDGNEILFGYTFFLSSNTNFDYSWSYLRKQIDKYVDFTFDTYRFICYLLKDINTMKSDLSGIQYLHIEFNGLFDVTFIDDKPFVKTIVHWENFYQINKVKNGYYISVKIDKTTLLTYDRKYNNELNPFLNKVKQLLTAWKEQTDKNNKA